MVPDATYRGLWSVQIMVIRRQLDPRMVMPEYRRQVQLRSALSLLDFSFPRSRLRISKFSGRRRRRRKIRSFLGEPERPKVLHFASNPLPPCPFEAGNRRFVASAPVAIIGQQSRIGLDGL